MSFCILRVQCTLYILELLIKFHCISNFPVQFLTCICIFTLSVVKLESSLIWRCRPCGCLKSYAIRLHYNNGLCGSVVGRASQKRSAAAHEPSASSSIKQMHLNKRFHYFDERERTQRNNLYNYGMCLHHWNQPPYNEQIYQKWKRMMRWTLNMARKCTEKWKMMNELKRGKSHR